MGLKIKMLKEDLNGFNQDSNVIIDGNVVGYICKLHPSVCSDFDLNDTFIAQIDFSAAQALRRLG